MKFPTTEQLVQEDVYARITVVDGEVVIEALSNETTMELRKFGVPLVRVCDLKTREEEREQHMSEGVQALADYEKHVEEIFQTLGICSIPLCDSTPELVGKMGLVTVDGMSQMICSSHIDEARRAGVRANFVANAMERLVQNGRTKIESDHDQKRKDMVKGFFAKCERFIPMAAVTTAHKDNGFRNDMRTALTHK